MPNIAVTNFCNLKCKYCFADDMIQSLNKSIALEDFKEILSYCARTPGQPIGIIGGEPTLHPFFSDIIKEVNTYCRELNTGATLFTNAINLEEYLPELGDRIGILINVNSPKEQGQEKWDKMIKTLDKCAELSLFDRKVNIGCNIYPLETDYSFIWELCDKYHIDHVRTSVCAPSACFAKMRTDKSKYFATMKPLYLQFLKDAKEHGVHCNMDCGHIPFCYFNAEEKALVEEVTGGTCHSDFCEPVIDITSDFHATACFGAYDPVDIRDFDNLEELRRFLLLEKNYPKSVLNTSYGKCSTCRKAKNHQCQGGCLGFACEAESIADKKAKAKTDKE